MTEVALKCTCGEIQRVARNIAAGSGTPIMCYCDNYQAFARFLDRENEILDIFGETDIFQITPSQHRISKGAGQIRCIRLTAKGMFRRYADCCKTPIGNTLGAGVPFVGVIHNFMNAGTREISPGPIQGHVNPQSVKASLPPELQQAGVSILLIAKMLARILRWKFKGLNKPSPFFDAQGKPVSQPAILKL